MARKNLRGPFGRWPLAVAKRAPNGQGRRQNECDCRQPAGGRAKRRKFEMETGSDPIEINADVRKAKGGGGKGTPDALRLLRRPSRHRRAVWNTATDNWMARVVHGTTANSSALFVAVFDVVGVSCGVVRDCSCSCFLPAENRLLQAAAATDIHPGT